MFLYNLIVQLYFFLIYLASPFYSKAKKSIQGRKDFFNRQQLSQSSDRFIWVHCASLGEFEQGRPLIEKIKRECPQKKILLSFFSPSGYEIRKNYDCADKVVYLPFDSKNNAKKFIEFFNIEMAIFVKYDLWPFYLKALLKKQIPTYVVSATFRTTQFYFRSYGRFMNQILKKLNGIYVQDHNSEKIALDDGFTNVMLAGDLRIDRVIEIKNRLLDLTQLDPFLQKKQAVIFGSIWPQDEPVLDEFLQLWKGEQPIIVVPHSVHDRYIQHLKNKYVNAILWSDLHNYSDQKILIVNNIGLLNQLYRNASMAYIGGGFGKSIHNILEPAVFGIPVFFGPKYQKFMEAIEFVDKKIGFTSIDKHLLANMMSNYLIRSNDSKVQELCKNWFDQKCGSTNLVFNHLQKSQSELLKIV